MARSQIFCLLFLGVSGVQIAFFDIAKGSAAFSPPWDVRLMFSYAYAVGARVHSNSWGSNIAEKTRYMDTFAYENQDFLPLFAAGNTGPKKMTINAPGKRNC